MKFFDYTNIRNLLYSEIKSVPGVISVGISKKNKVPVLLVAIDSTILSDELPKRYRGIEVIIRDFGKAKFEVFNYRREP